ncbi:LOG family protein [Rummeliibacillus pycnus]|uniref:LOG family protein n=1 Tax=Rummeliibacillus pycnus TaxID=101070 RepID=UPI001B8017B5|nr:TIGR00730 family Rossman fold protein [Rummeliibacillus pycnus]
MRVGIYCGSKVGKNPIYVQKAEELGAYLARNQIDIVYGGSNQGLMGKIADAAIANSGHVIGVMPDFFHWKEVIHEHITELHYVKTLHERKAKMMELADLLIALPGGAGTMDEFFDVVTLSQIGQHHKPICLYNINHYYQLLRLQLQYMVDEGFMQQEQLDYIYIVQKPEDLLQIIQKKDER